jgi:hypothetical protein
MIYPYLTRLQTIMDARADIHVDWYTGEQIGPRDGRLFGRLRFHDGSVLEFREEFEVRDHDIHKIVYAYHYQRPDGSFFRYDSAPHHPELPGCPEHKHVSGQEKPEPAPAPDLTDVLREIDAILYPQGRIDD